jgi:hypothetical protein
MLDDLSHFCHLNPVSYTFEFHHSFELHIFPSILNHPIVVPLDEAVLIISSSRVKNFILPLFSQLLPLILRYLLYPSFL